MLINRYDRNISAISKEEQEILKNKKIFVAGSGGLGGYVINYLLRIGVKQITLVDYDVFSESNLNRQLLSFEDNIGKQKVEEAKLFAKRVNSEVKFNVINEKIEENNAENLINGVDIVIDALDNIEARKALAKACDKLVIPYVYGAVSNWIMQVAVFSPGNIEKCINYLYPKNIEIQNKSVLSFTTGICAGYEVSESLKVLLKRESELMKNNKMLFIDLLSNECEYIPILN